MSKPSIKITVETSELKKAIEEAEQLVEILKKANSLVDEMANKNVNINLQITEAPSKFSIERVADALADALRKEIRT